MFWSLLEATGLTGEEWVGPSRDQTVVEYGVGLTDLVGGRGASSDAQLRSGDFDVPGFVAKVTKFGPKVVAFNGRKATETLARHLGHPLPPEGPIDWTIEDSLAYRLPSSSSANAAGGFASKRAKWAAFGKWVRESAT